MGHNTCKSMGRVLCVVRRQGKETIPMQKKYVKYIYDMILPCQYLHIFQVIRYCLLAL